MCATVCRECLRRRQFALIGPPAPVLFHKLPGHSLLLTDVSLHQSLLVSLEGAKARRSISRRSCKPKPSPDQMCERLWTLPERPDRGRIALRRGFLTLCPPSP